MIEGLEVEADKITIERGSLDEYFLALTGGGIYDN